MSQQMTFWEKVENLDRRWLFLATFLIITIPMLKPVRLPFAVTQETRGFYDAINALQPGDVVFFNSAWDANSLAENRPQALAAYEQLMKKGVRVILYSSSDKGPQFSQPLMQQAAAKYGRRYGADWVNVGFIPIDPPTVQAIAQDFHRMFKKDYPAGTPTDQLPLFQQVKGMDDVKLFVDIEYQPTEDWIKFVNGPPYRTPMVFGMASIVSTAMFPYLATGQLKGMLVGPRGAAEYEKLLVEDGTYPDLGEGYRTVLPLGFAPIIIVIFVILGNLAFQFKPKKAGSGAP
ncbi:MAG: hypothetical protein ACREJQ_01915 [bacterium]